MVRGVSIFRRAGAGLAAAAVLGGIAIAAFTPASASQTITTAWSFPAPIHTQKFAIAPTTWNERGVDMGVGPDTISFTRFELTGSARATTRDIAVGNDNNIWISTDCVGTIVRLTPAGKATAFSYGAPNNCNETSTSLTPGPDGNLWFADQFANLIGKITPRGVITTFALPAAQPCNYYPSAPLGIVAGSDGAMWFSVTDPGNPFCQGQPALAPAIGRITMTGSMTFFYTAPAGTVHVTSPERVTLGPDGNVYFIANEDRASPNLALGVITPAGSISYTAPFSMDANFNDYLAVGPDNNLWMTDEFNGLIDRITLGGGITSFRIPLYHGLQETAYGIAAGPDGKSLWFTTSDDNELGRITTSGKITFHAEPSCSPNNCGSAGGIVRRLKAVWHTLPGNRQSEDVVEAKIVP